MKVYYKHHILRTSCSHSWPSSGMCITKYRYIEILQFLSNCSEVKLNFKLNTWFTVHIKVKIQIRVVIDGDLLHTVCYTLESVIDSS
jgi:hypothetical protein